MNKHEKFSIRKYDHIANQYDASFDGKFTANFKKIILEICAVSDGDRVLDVGCGNGRLINEISHKAKIKAYGVDISPNMIRICRQRYGDIHFSVTTGERLPFENGSFDLLIMCCTLHHLNNPRNFFVEAQRIMKRNGLLLVGEPWLPFGLRQFTDWIISPLIRAGDNKLFSRTRLQRLFTDNGFEILDIYKKGIKQIIIGRK